MIQGDVFRAVANATRRDILRLVGRGPLTSEQIAGKFDIAWDTILRHLAVLRAAGLLLSVRQKRQVRYELNGPALHDLAGRILEWTAVGTGRARIGGNRHGSHSA